MQNNGKILIIGGYGAVGKIISTALANLFLSKVIVAGRNYKKAKNLAVELNKKVSPLELDIESIDEDDERLIGVSIVLMCIDQKNTEFVRQCVKRGIHYIDITANYDFLSKIELLDNEAKENNSTVILSVGVAPGLTNLLAKHCKQISEDIQFTNIYILLGLGEKHGEAAYHWTFNDFNDEFYINEGKCRLKVKSFEDGRQIVFSDKIGKRMAYRSNFSDQHVIPKTLDISSVSTRLCFDSAFMTSLYALIKKTGLSKLVKLKIVQDSLIKFFKIFRFGSDQFALKLEAGVYWEEGRLYECSINGNGQGYTTGLVAAKVAEKLYTSTFDSGVHHIENLFDPVDLIQSLSVNLNFEESFLMEKKIQYITENLQQNKDNQ